jgi:hypothetical protein
MICSKGDVMNIRLGIWSGTRTLSVFTAFLMMADGLPARLPAQTPAPAKLNIVILEGEGAINNLRQRVARETIVQVEDENHKPLSGVAVVFLLPDHGPSGVFLDGSRSLSVTTDAQGRAVARGIQPNKVAGKMEIRVSAKYQGLTANTTVVQTNVAAAVAAGGISAKLLTLIVICAAGAAAGTAVALTRGGTTTTVVTPGTPTVGAPR